MVSTGPPLLITNLPPEILSAIFQNGVNNTRLSSFLAQPAAQTEKPLVFEVAISHTCSYFRKIALGNPLLWTSIIIDANSDKQDLLRRISRSHLCALDIRVHLSYQDLWMAESDQMTMLDIIFPHSFRWRSLCARFHNEVANHPVVRRLCDCAAPYLEHLSLAVHNVEDASSASVNIITDVPQIFQPGTPNLKFLRLRGVAIHHFRPSLGNMVTLHLEQTRQLPLLYSTFRSILTSSPYLADLSLHGDIILPTAWVGHDSLIYLPRLRTLRMFSESGAMYSGLLLGIDAPMLESLTLKGVHEPDLDAIWRPENVVDYTHLQYLHFLDFELSVSAYAKMFRTFSEVREYSATHLFPSQSALLTALSYGTTPGARQSIVPWPSLESLSFSFDSGENNTILAQVAAIRESVGRPLSHFFLTMEEDEFQQRPWEGTTANVGGDVDVKFFAVNCVWPLNGVHGGDQDDIMFL